MTSLESVDAELAVPAEIAERAAMDGERRKLSGKTSEVLAEALHSISSDDRHILQLRFEAEMSVAQISRSLQLDQRGLFPLTAVMHFAAPILKATTDGQAR